MTHNGSRLVVRRGIRNTKLENMIKRLIEKLKTLRLYFVSDSTNDCTCGKVKRCGQRAMYCEKNDWWYR